MAVLSHGHGDELPVRGDLLKWAREAQGLTLRQVQDRNGPSPAYQSEVERGHKGEVRSQVLTRWIEVLQISEPFARGRIPRYQENPAACQGLAGRVKAHIKADEATNWTDMSPMERARQVLVRIPKLCQDLPKVVLAYVLNLEVETLSAMLVGTHPITPPVKQAILHLTTLSESFLRHGAIDGDLPDLAELAPYLPTLRLAQQIGLGPNELFRLVKQVTTEEETGSALF